MTIGSGRVIYQNSPNIARCPDGSFFKNEAFMNAMRRVKEMARAPHHGTRRRRIGAISSRTTSTCCSKWRRKTNSRMSSFTPLPTGAIPRQPPACTRSKEVMSRTAMLGVGTLQVSAVRNRAWIATTIWARVEKAYQYSPKAPLNGRSRRLRGVISKRRHRRIYRACRTLQNGKPVGIIQDRDSVIFFNYREDRAREITKGLLASRFRRLPSLQNSTSTFVTMTEYERNLLFTLRSRKKVTNALGEVLSKHGRYSSASAKPKIRASPYFFNGGTEPGREKNACSCHPQLLISTRFPEMSSAETANKTIEAVNRENTISSS